MSEHRPDFLIGGAPRSGTTWLYHLLDCHPDVYMAKPVRPEPKFFLVDEHYERGLDYYLRSWFADVPDGKIAGEKSTDYLESSKAASRIHRHLPDVKLVFILRNPVERAFSNYLWSRMNGLETEDFTTALDLEHEREGAYESKWRHVRPHSYYSRGLYAGLLKPYFALFAKQAILVLRFEDILVCPDRLTRRLHEFLGVAPRPADARGVGVINASDKGAEPMSPEARKRLADAYAEPNQELAELLDDDFNIWSEV